MSSSTGLPGRTPATDQTATVCGGTVVKDLVGDLRPVAVVDHDTASMYATGVNRATGPHPYEDTVIARLTDRYAQDHQLNVGQSAALARAANSPRQTNLIAVLVGAEPVHPTGLPGQGMSSPLLAARQARP
ncbi:hypothetical protein DMB42_24615 [Nonomuraea sp. WAC 01424]|uniref:hypothetical protein n=1 Tax=Nonomuraea sp. WAC 01424 TaxID=2203200 RepID=UPI000F79157F|nr:hypothetical protein [Nonomuraea sp. WAC 01424]RSN06475.1 hypothetical protein DMB42_24615 [Nonomuraea sp. WAC 01424]